MSELAPLESLLPTAPLPYLLGDGEGDKLVLFDQLFTLLTTSPQTAGQFDAFITEGRPGRPVPPHFHAETHETFFVLEGAIRLWIDDQRGNRETRILEAGGFGFVPKDTIHSYRIERTGKIFGVTSAGFTDFFRAGIPGLFDGVGYGGAGDDTVVVKFAVAGNDERSTPG